MKEQCQESRPSKENHLHNAHRKRRLQHRTRLIHMQRERVIRAHAVLAERAERNPDGPAVPAGTVCVGDEAELVDGCDEGTEEEGVHEGDEEGGALGC